MSELFWFILLFFFVIVMGFFFGWCEGKCCQCWCMDLLFQEYVVGFNFFFNEELDKVVQVLFNSLEVNDQILEMYFSMVCLFCKCGEFDCVILIYFYFFEQGELFCVIQEQIQLELVEDYFVGGLFDWVEEVLLEMFDQECEKCEQVICQFIYLYEQECDWINVIFMGEYLVKLQFKIVLVLVYYCCEEVEVQIVCGEFNLVCCMLCCVFGFDKNCVCVSVLQGCLEMCEEDWNVVIDVFCCIWKQDLDFFDEVFSELCQCFQVLEKEEDFICMFVDYSVEIFSIVRVLLLFEQLCECYGDCEVGQFIVDYMQVNFIVFGLYCLIDMNLQGLVEGEVCEYLGLFKVFIEWLISGKIVYQCCCCGFQILLLQWCCFSCCCWGIIKFCFEGEIKL